MVRRQYIIHITHKVCVHWLFMVSVSVRLLVNSRLLVVKFWGSQNLQVFSFQSWEWGMVVPLTPPSPCSRVNFIVRYYSIFEDSSVSQLGLPFPTAPLPRFYHVPQVPTSQSLLLSLHPWNQIYHTVFIGKNFSTSSPIPAKSICNCLYPHILVSLHLTGRTNSSR